MTIRDTDIPSARPTRENRRDGARRNAVRYGMPDGARARLKSIALLALVGFLVETGETQDDLRERLDDAVRHGHQLRNIAVRKEAVAVVGNRTEIDEMRRLIAVAARDGPIALRRLRRQARRLHVERGRRADA